MRNGTLSAAALVVLACAACSPPAAGLCTLDTDCVAGSSCVSGQCKACPSCSAGEVCLKAQCFAAACGDQPCRKGQACVASVCVDSECLDKTCPADQTCAKGTCFPKDCAAVTCQSGEICWQGTCRTSLCQGVQCPQGQTCADGQCLPTACLDVSCAEGTVCDNGSCEQPRCVGVTCAAGSVCADGRCVPQTCGGNTCPSGFGCVGGSCVDTRCLQVNCPASQKCLQGACVACAATDDCPGPADAGEEPPDAGPIPDDAALPPGPRDAGPMPPDGAMPPDAAVTRPDGSLPPDASSGPGNVNFASGALIIPMQSSFQQQGGMVSAYGMVWRILLANQAGHRNASTPVTVYVVDKPAKASPNRCIPTNLSSFNSTVPSQASAMWTDGCDFAITNPVRQPVVPVDYSVSFPAGAGIYPDAVVPNFDDTTAWPRFNTATLTTSSGFTTVSYLGAPFVIAAADAPHVIDLLKNGDTGPKAPPKAAIDLFTDGQRKYGAACNPATLDDTVTGNSTCTPKSCTALGFDCGDAGDGCGGRINCSPSHTPGDTSCANGAYNCGAVGPNKCGTGNNCTPSTTCPVNGCGWTGDGCGATHNCGACASGSLCGISSPGVCAAATPELSAGCHYVQMHQATTGFTASAARTVKQWPKIFAVYQSYSGDSSRNGSPPSGVLAGYFKISGLWVKGTGTSADTVGCPVGNVSNCTFNGSTTAGPGVEATAAQVVHGVICDQLDTADMDHTSTTYPNGALNYGSAGGPFYSLFWAPHWHTLSDNAGDDRVGIANVVHFASHGGNLVAECASITSYENGFGAPTAGLATPAADSGPGMGSNFFFTSGINVSSVNGGKNCSDPGAVAPCVNYPNPGEVFAQIGDWPYVYRAGENDGFKALGGSAYQAWARRLLGGTNGSDAFAMGQKDSSHGVSVYVAGHDLSDTPVGARVVLNATLLLGAR